MIHSCITKLTSVSLLPCVYLFRFLFIFFIIKIVMILLLISETLTNGFEKHDIILITFVSIRYWDYFNEKTFLHLEFVLARC